MRVRAVDADGDWQFGKGRNDYVVNNKAIEQSIKTRLQSFLGDCFFDLQTGIDWFNLLGSKNQIALELAVRGVILNTTGVTKLITSSVSLESSTRLITMNYTVETIYTAQALGETVIDSSSFLLTEGGAILTTEDGNPLVAG